MDRNELDQRLPQVVASLEHSIQAYPKLQHLNRVYLPSRELIIDIIKRLRDIVFPGYFGRQGLTEERLQYSVRLGVGELTDLMYDQVRCCLRYREQIPGSARDGDDCGECDREGSVLCVSDRGMRAR